MNGAKSNGAARLPALAHALVTLLAIGAVWCVDYLPTHDGPQHIYGVHAAQRLDAPAMGYGRFLEPNVPITSHGFALVFAPFDLFLPWRAATRMALSCMVLLWCAGSFWLVRALEVRRAWIGVALAAFAFQWSLYMGLFSYYVATAFGWFVLAAALAPEPWSRGRRIGVAGLLFAQALMHVVAAAIVGAILLALAGARAPRGERVRALARSVVTGIPAACVALLVLVAGLDDLARSANGMDASWTPASASLWSLAGCFGGGPWWRTAAPFALALSAPPVAWWLARRTAWRATDGALCAAGLALLALVLAAPLHLRAWDYFSVRFLPAAVCCLAVSWPVERLASRAARALLAALLAGSAFASASWPIGYNRSLAEHVSGALAGLDADLVRDGARLPIVLEPYFENPFAARRASMPFVVPLANLGQLYATAQGGFAPNSFALSRWIHPVLLREEARRHFPPTVDRSYAVDLAKPAFADDPALREAITAYLAAVGTRYQDVILWGRPADAERLVRMGYEPQFQRGGLLLASFRGCPFTLRFPPDSQPPPGTLIELGWLPAWHVTHRYAADKRAPDASGQRALPLAATPCSGVWIRLAGRPDAPAPLECEGSDRAGRLSVDSVRDTPEIECRLRARAAHALAPGAASQRGAG